MLKVRTYPKKSIPQHTFLKIQNNKPLAKENPTIKLENSK